MGGGPWKNGQKSVDLTWNDPKYELLPIFNKIAIQGTLYMATDMEAIDLSTVHIYYFKYNPPLQDIYLFCS